MAASLSGSLHLKEALEIAGWPCDLLAAQKQPRVVQNTKVYLNLRMCGGRTADRHKYLCQELEEVLLYGTHVDDIIVLREGVRKLNQEDAVPPEVMRAARAPCVRSFLHQLDDDALRDLRGRVYCTTEHSRNEYELKKRKDGRWVLARQSCR